MAPTDFHNAGRIISNHLLIVPEPAPRDLIRSCTHQQVAESINKMDAAERKTHIKKIKAWLGEQGDVFEKVVNDKEAAST